MARRMLKERGFAVDEKWNDYTVCVKLHDIRLRIFDYGIPYKIVWSDIMLAKREIYSKPSYRAPERQLCLDDIISRLSTGKSIEEYLGSRQRSVSIDKSDFLLKNWGIHHAHLDLIDGKYRGGRKAELLFFHVRGNVAHLIDVMPHPAGNEWYSSKLIEIEERNWPWLLMPMPNDIRPVVDLPDDKVHETLKRCCSVVKVGRKYYFPTTLGDASSGDSTDAVRTTDWIFNTLYLNEQKIKDSEPLLRNEYRKLFGVRLPAQFKVYLIVQNGKFYVLIKSEHGLPDVNIMTIPINDLTYYESELKSA